jgi:hypothetical protein
MGTSIQRRDLDARISGYVDIDHPSADLATALRENRITPNDLRDLAETTPSGDHVIRGGEKIHALFQRIAELERSRFGASADINRTNRLYRAVSAELERSRGGAPLSRPTVPIIADGAHPPTGLRPKTTYALPALPEITEAKPAPEQKCWFTRLLECLFQWLPGVNTDGDRLRDFGRQLADSRQSDIQAIQDGYNERALSRPPDRFGIPVQRTNTNAEARQAMIDTVSRRMIADEAAHGNNMSKDTADERATIVVDAMLARAEENKAANRQNVSGLGLPDPTLPEAPSLAEAAIPARAEANALGAAWTARVNAALATPPANHPWLTSSTPDKVARWAVALRTENVKAVSYLMALQRSGQLANVPSQTIDGLLAAQRAGTIDANAVPDTVSRLGEMNPAERTALLSSIEALPADRKAFAYAILAREHVGLSSSNPNDRQGSMTRVQNAIRQLQGMTPSQAADAFRRGTLGLDGPENVAVTYDVKGKKTTVNIPVYMHPALSADQRTRYAALIQEAYSKISYPMMQRIMAGEGGEPFAVRVFNAASIHSDLPTQGRPTSVDPEAGRYEAGDNGIRINADDMDRMLATFPGAEGRSRVVGMILHESAHDLDDLSDPDQMQGKFITLGPSVANLDARLGPQGDLAPAWRHFSAITSRYDALKRDMDDNDARAAYMLGSRDPRTDVEERAFFRASERVAGRSGAVTPYAANGGDETRRNPGLNLAEWWAETYSNYLNPSTRDRLRTIDPVAFAACQKATELMDKGATPQDAMTQAVRFSLSTEVSGQQGTAILSGTPRSASLTADNLRDLDGIADAYEMHAKALDGWTPFGGDKDLAKMRGQEAQAGVTSGRALLDRIAQRKADLLATGRGTSAEFKRLTAIETRLQKAVSDLDARSRPLTS